MFGKYFKRKTPNLEDWAFWIFGGGGENQTPATLVAPSDSNLAVTQLVPATGCLPHKLFLSEFLKVVCRTHFTNLPVVFIYNIKHSAGTNHLGYARRFVSVSPASLDSFYSVIREKYFVLLWFQCTHHLSCVVRGSA